MATWSDFTNLFGQMNERKRQKEAKELAEMESSRLMALEQARLAQEREKQQIQAGLARMALTQGKEQGPNLAGLGQGGSAQDQIKFEQQLALERERLGQEQQRYKQQFDFEKDKAAQERERYQQQFGQQQQRFGLEQQQLQQQLGQEQQKYALMKLEAELKRRDQDRLEKEAAAQINKIKATTPSPTAWNHGIVLGFPNAYDYSKSARLF